MSLEDHIRTRECPECGEDGLIEREFVQHSSMFDGMFPQYYVCGVGDDSDNLSPVYLRIDSETGPIWMAKECWDFVERPPMNELLRHDWEITYQEDTPFPRFEG